ncbi:MAG: hypothetical protein ABEI77_06400 [Halorientalis sp.]
MTEHTTVDKSSDRPYRDEIRGLPTPPTDLLAESAAKGPNGRAVRAYVNDLVGVKGPSDEPALDLIEYVQHVTSDQRRRRKEPRNMRYDTALLRHTSES